MRWWNRLSVKIPLITLLITLTPLIFIGYETLTETRKTLVEQLRNIHSETASRASDIARASIEAIIREIEVGAGLLEIDMDDPLEMEWSLTVLQKEIPEVFQFSVMDTQGNEKAKLNTSKVFSQNELGNVSGDPAFEQALNKKIYMGEVNTSENGIQVLKLALPILEARDGSVKAVLFAEAFVQKITEKISRITVGKTGTLFVLDKDGKIISHPDWSKVLVRESYADNPHFQHYKAGHFEKLEQLHPYETEEGDRLLITGKADNVLGWVFMAQQRAEEAFALIESLKQNLIFLLSIAIILVFLVTLYFFIRLNNPLRRLQLATERIGEGKLDERVEINTGDEIGQVASAFNTMAENLHEADKERNLESWYKTGKAKLEDRMRGEQSARELCRNIITYLAKYLNAPVGVIYVNEDNDRLSMIASHAFTVRKHSQNEFAFGQGLVGQAALEKQPIILANVPDDYLAIASGLGETRPKNILVVPLIFNDEVIAVIELGALEGFSSREHTFLENTQNAMAVAIHTARVRVRLKEALELTKRQKESLQKQQEELKVSNEELEEQTGQLQESEKRLKEQQEELRVANEELEEKAQELEEKTQELEEKKEALEFKNSDLMKIQAELEEKARQLETTSGYKSEFLANMSHELRTPLNSLLLLARDLAENKRENLDEGQQESARIIYQSGQDLLELINEILDLSKIEAGQMKLHFETVNIPDLKNGIIEIFRPMAEESGLELVGEIDPAAPKSLVSDRQRVEQILRNLVSNAIKFTNEGSVTLHFQGPGKKSLPRELDLEPNKYMAISVIDTGIGIPEDRIDEVFIAFRQLDGSPSRSRGGTGLGLSISRELARLLGGGIQIQSEVGKGSTFTLYLPLEERRAAKTQKPKRVEKEKSDKPVAVSGPNLKKFAFQDDREHLQEQDSTILVIEDDLAFAKTVCELCRERGFKCIQAFDGEDGLAMAAKYKPDAIILDIRLPKKNGWEVLNLLKSDPALRHIPVHMMSVEEETLEAYRRGAIGFLSKPVTRESLGEAFGKIESALAGKPKKLLIIEDDPVIQKKIISLIEEKNVEIKAVSTGKDALEELAAVHFECVILDLKLPDMTGFDLLEELKRKTRGKIPPIIVYTGRELTREEDYHLRKYASSIIIKGVRSEERLLDETSLFLHQVVEKMPDRKQKMISKLYVGDEIFAGKKVLIVDDDMRNVFAISKIFEDRGINVFKAADGKQALSTLEDNPDIELVLMDIMMPVMDGYEAMRRIRRQERFKQLPIIAVTAKAMSDDREKCIEAGASDYFSKPIEIDRLLSLMRIWLYK